ncbi:MAG: hypothetical protein A2Y78_10155 [Acidobacteria bacterium RBG_13_68_16]|nr:MAG: hypothetical protein A2Y78_10155 [Acidobacteria bacterium RBG_13_68_16]
MSEDLHGDDVDALEQEDVETIEGIPPIAVVVEGAARVRALPRVASVSKNWTMPFPAGGALPAAVQVLGRDPRRAVAQLWCTGAAVCLSETQEGAIRGAGALLAPAAPPLSQTHTGELWAACAGVADAVLSISAEFWAD